MTLNLIMLSVLPKAQLARVSEEDFRRAVIAHAVSRGWLWYGVDKTATRKVDGGYRGLGPPGFPDLLLLRGAAARAYELKAERGTVSPAQKEWLAALQEAGITTAVWRPRDASALLVALK